LDPFVVNPASMGLEKIGENIDKDNNCQSKNSIFYKVNTGQN